MYLTSNNLKNKTVSFKILSLIWTILFPGIGTCIILIYFQFCFRFHNEGGAAAYQQYPVCKGKQLTCSNNILNRMGEFNQVTSFFPENGTTLNIFILRILNRMGEFNQVTSLSQNMGSPWILVRPLGEFCQVMNVTSISPRIWHLLKNYYFLNFSLVTVQCLTPPPLLRRVF
jgi:hypothetical protein